jgi:hypothetical protein
MDSIDITNPEFLLDIPNSIEVNNSFDTTNYMYIGIIFLILTLCFLLYKFLYVNKIKHVTFQDTDNLNHCYDTGICKR